MNQGESSQVQSQPQADSSTIKRILFNALEHFSRYGYSGASVREITHASQVTKPTLYYYFKNKEELYTKLSETCFEEILSRIERAISQPVTTKQRILSLIREYCSICEEKRSVARFVHLIALAPDRTAPDVGVAQFNLRIGDYFKQVLMEGVERGEVKAENVEPMIFALYSVFYLEISNLLAKDPIPHDFSLVERSVAIILA